MSVYDIETKGRLPREPDVFVSTKGGPIAGADGLELPAGRLPESGEKVSDVDQRDAGASESTEPTGTP